MESVNVAASLLKPGDATVLRGAPVAQGIERPPPERKVVGSIPTGRIPTGAATRRPVFAGCRSTGSDDAAVLA
jgi:hypothetical protein